MKTLPTEYPIERLISREQLNKLLYAKAGMKESRESIDAKFGIIEKKPEHITNML